MGRRIFREDESGCSIHLAPTITTVARGDMTFWRIVSGLMASGKTVLLPMTQNTRYDLLLDDAGEYVRIQCKTGRIINNGSVLTANACSSNHKGKRKSYNGDVDVFAIYSPELDKIYLCPMNETIKNALWLRVKEPLVKSNKPVKWAKDFEL